MDHSWFWKFFFIKQELAFELGGKECVREEFYKEDEMCSLGPL